MMPQQHASSGGGHDKQTYKQTDADHDLDVSLMLIMMLMLA
jgi:hypothetical protein